MIHNSLHEEEKRQFERLLHQLGVERVGDRLSVLDAFLTSEEHHTAEGWQGIVKKRGVDLELDFVSQTLELMTRLGLAMRRDFEGELPRYEHRHLDEHHDHLICTRCGSITEFHHPQLEALQDEVVRDQGFHCLRHRLQVYGLCQKCLSDRQPTMPLALAAPGERVRVEKVASGVRACRQLEDMGLNPGTEVEVISSNGGPMVVAVKGTRIALGRGAAQKVLVSNLPVK
ncbi:MAG: transcriptional repressor [Desulfarculaceae bacterium]|jgi:Fur family ferric uptake transcriptional regulator